MNVEPDGHWVWLVVNAGFAVYDGYKAYKSGKGWKGAAVAAGSGFLGGGKLKGIKKISQGFKKSKKNKKSKKINKRINKVARTLKFDSKAFKHAQNRKRSVPRYILSTAIVTGKKKNDGAKGYSAYWSTMYKNSKKYKLKVVYNSKTKKVRHFHYQSY